MRGGREIYSPLIEKVETSVLKVSLDGDLTVG